MNFDALFAAAVTKENESSAVPAPYQRRVAEQRPHMPDVLTAPTGTGKTEAVFLGWLYRRRFASDAVRRRTPRRLVIALPMRVLVEATARRIDTMLDRLVAADVLTPEERMPVCTLMAGTLSGRAVHDWRMRIDGDSIVVGTVDAVVSRQLNRGYGTGRKVYPVDFALVTNDAHVVIDEIQLARQATATARQIRAFQSRYATAGPVGLTCMSATIDASALDTVDNPYPGEALDVISLEPGDDNPPAMRRRLEARRLIRQLPLPAKGTVEKAVAEQARALHLDGTVTLVVVNRVDEAKSIYSHLSSVAAKNRAGDPDKNDPELLLLHSRFRGIERRALDAHLQELTGEGPKNAIVVATQTVEAGVDLDSATMITEVCPWPSFTQRAGRNNRQGLLSGDDHGVIYWFATKTAAPYEPADVFAAETALRDLEGKLVTSTDLLEQLVPVTRPRLSLLRAPTFEELFDTSPDLSDIDVDISRYIRDDDGRDVQVAWVDGETVSAGLVGRGPTAEWRVSVPIGQLRAFLRASKPSAWRFNPSADNWTPLRATDGLRPQDLVLIDRDSGGYSAALGFDSKLTDRVAIGPDDDADVAPNDDQGDDTTSDPGTFTGAWQRLDEHLAQARTTAEAVIARIDRSSGATLDDRLGSGVTLAVVVAVFLHDLGKAFPGWQEGLRATGVTADGRTLKGWPVPPPGLLAKAPSPAKKPPAAPREADNAPPLDDDAESNAILKAIRRRVVVRAAPRRSVGELAAQEGLAITAPVRRTFRHEFVSMLLLRTPAGHAVLERLGVDRDRFGLVHYLIAAHHGVLRVGPRDPRTSGQDAKGERTVLGLVDGEFIEPITLGEISLPATRVDFGLFAGGPESWGRNVIALLDEFGPFRLAYLETLVRMSDWRASAELSATGPGLERSPS